MSNPTQHNSFLRPLLRGWPVILLTMITGIAIGKKYLKYTTPVFESTAKIKLADTHEGIPNGNLYKDLDVFANTNKIGAEVELLHSKVLIKKAVAKLDITISVYRVGDIHKTEMYDQSPFIVSAALTNLKMHDRPFTLTISQDSIAVLTTPEGETIHSTLNRIIETRAGSILLRRNDALLKSRPALPLNDRYEFIVHSENRLLDDVIANLDIMAVDKDVPVLRISYKSTVPQKSADVVNALSAAYITDYIDEKYKSADTASRFLDAQLKEFSGKLAASENAIEGYRTEHNIINIRQETETDLRKIADLKKQLASVQMNLNAIDTLNAYMAGGSDRFIDLAPNFEQFTDLLSTELIKKTKELQREKRDLLTKYTPEHEKVKVVDDKLDDISRYMKESIHNSEKSLRIKYDDLQETISESEKVFIGLPTREKNMTIMERNFGLNEQIYRFLREKRTEAEIAKAATISFHRIISPGELPVKPVSPNTAIIKIMAAILGISAGILLVYGIHIIKARVNNRDTINRMSGIPVLGGIPFLRADKTVARAAIFRRLALEIQLKGLAPAGSIITITSFSGKEGKSFCTDNLASAFTAMDKKILLIDASAETAHLNSPSAWNQFLQPLRKQHDLIIVRNRPLKTDPSSIIPMAPAQLNLFVADSRVTRKSIIQEIETMQAELSFPGLHFILNREGYNPSLLMQVVSCISAFVKRPRK